VYTTQAGLFVPYGLIILLVFVFLFFSTLLLCLLGMRVLPVYYVSCISLVRNFLPSFLMMTAFFWDGFLAD
jgi:hypothetical protein